jgi:hypothetical protein
MTDLQTKFTSYRALVHAVGIGSIRCLLVGGAPGLGKTHECTATLADFGARIKVTRSAGRTTPLQLYRDLFEGRTVRDVLVFDDCDDAFKNKDCLNILKAAADTRNPREITWATSVKSRVPNKFEFAGRLIVITNQPVFDNPTLQPLIDRAHCFELVLNQAERLERILSLLRAIARDEGIYYEVADWITRHQDPLHSLARLTVRTAVKACELARLRHGDWQHLAGVTLLHESEE